MKWRLILDGPAPGAWNMAVDEALLLAHAAGESPPTLRFYAWNPACLSLGRLQKTWESATDAAPFDVVRRPTGGRAVWHQHEVTYAAVVRQELLPRANWSVVGAYQWLSRGFLPGLRALGANVELAAVADGGAVATKPRPGANCFTVSTGDCDFTVDGRKLIGAAQCRRDDTILQHGSLLLAIDEAAWRQAAGGTMANAISLRDIGLDVTAEVVARALAAGFARGHELDLGLGTLSAAELTVARSLQRTKYGTQAWTERGTAP